MRIIATAFLLLVLPVTSVEAQQEGKQASLAIDQRNGDQYGWAVEHDTRSAADSRALAECRKHGSDDCRVVLRFTGGCGAYVVERGNPVLYGWGTADSRSAAESRARSEAQERGGEDLVVRAWGCNGGSLDRTDEEALTVDGVYLFHFVYAQDENKCFVTDPIYEPGVAHRVGGEWRWTNDAEAALTPVAARFMDHVEDDLYGYLGELKDQAISRGTLDWAGKNEVDFDPASLELSPTERRDRMRAGVNAAKQLCEDEGAEVVMVDVRR